MQEGESKLSKHPKASTIYLTIPADVVKDSTFPFKAGDKVSVRISDDFEGLEIIKVVN